MAYYCVERRELLSMVMAADMSAWLFEHCLKNEKGFKELH